MWIDSAVLFYFISDTEFCGLRVFVNVMLTQPSKIIKKLVQKCFFFFRRSSFKFLLKWCNFCEIYIVRQ